MVYIPRQRSNEQPHGHLRVCPYRLALQRSTHSQRHAASGDRKSANRAPMSWTKSCEHRAHSQSRCLRQAQAPLLCTAGLQDFDTSGLPHGCQQKEQILRSRSPHHSQHTLRCRPVQPASRADHKSGKEPLKTSAMGEEEVAHQDPGTPSLHSNELRPHCLSSPGIAVPADRCLTQPLSHSLHIAGRADSCSSTISSDYHDRSQSLALLQPQVQSTSKDELRQTGKRWLRRQGH